MHTTYTIIQALPLLKLHTMTVYDNIRKGRLNATLTIVNGKATYLITHDELHAFIAAREAKRNA